MPIDQHNLIKASKVDEDVFACLYQSPQAGICMLHLLKSDGSTVNTENAGFEMRNLTWNLNQPEINKADGAGDDVVYFVVLETQQYSLLLHGKEVWTFGEAPNMDTGLSTAAETERKATWDGILAFMQERADAQAAAGGNLPEIDPNHIVAVHTPSPDVTVTILNGGDMGIPWDPKLFLPNNY